MSKSKVMTCGLIAVLLALGICVWFMFGGVSTGSAFSYPDAEKYTAGGATVTDPVENLDIHWTEGFVRVEYHAGSGILISESSPKALSEENRLRWLLDGSTLRIQYAKAGLNLNWNLQKTLTVSLPEGTVLKTAGIRATSADVTVSGLVAEEIALNTTSGNMDVSSAASRLTAASTSGDLNIRQGSPLDSAVLSATSGNIACSLGTVKSVSIESTSGGIGLAVTEAADSVHMRSTSGSVYPELASVNRADFSSTSGSISAGLEAFGEVKFNSTSGNVTAALPGIPGFTCSVTTASGSFSSDLELAKSGNTYTCGDGSAACSITTTSGDIRILSR